MEILVCMETRGGNTLYFADADCNNFLTIERGYLNEPDKISILDKIKFCKNNGGNNSFIIGENDCILADDGSIYCSKLSAINGEAEISCNILKAFEHIYCNNGVESFSTIEKKKNIEKYNKSGLNEVLNTDIYYFNYKEDKEKAKNRIGAIIGEGYNCSEDILSQTKESISDYSMISVAYKAIQEQQEEIEKLKEKDRQKDILIQSLIERIEKLEKEVKDGKDKF